MTTYNSTRGRDALKDIFDSEDELPETPLIVLASKEGLPGAVNVLFTATPIMVRCVSYTTLARP